jgi:ABC-type Fe3+ transport system substrate-binding protein
MSSPRTAWNRTEAARKQKEPTLWQQLKTALDRGEIVVMSDTQTGGRYVVRDLVQRKGEKFAATSFGWMPFTGTVSTFTNMAEAQRYIEYREHETRPENA